MGAVGLAIDGSHLYAERQMAQAAADTAAQAGIRSVFTGSYASGSSQAFSGGLPSFTCATSDARTPCYYAQTLNGFNGNGDTVNVDEPTAAQIGISATALSSTDTINLLRVSVSRQVTTTLFKLIAPWTPTVTASATGAIVNILSPTPIIITHPTLINALDMNGNTSITITGGPQQSIQVNSNGTYPSAGAAYSGPSSGSVDLSGAGPAATGGNFGTFGGPSGTSCSGTACNSVNLGTTGSYLDPSYPILDPLAGVAAPTAPTGTPPPQSGQLCSKLGHCAGCPGGASSCTEFVPGLYGSGININNRTVMFDPGIYYMQSGGFTTKNSTVGMCGSTCTSDATTKDGMVVYDTGPLTGGCDASGGFTIDTNSNDVFYGAGVSATSLTGTPASPYYGILFFEDRNACAQTHTLGMGNGCFSIVGTIYITDSLSVMIATPARYQTVIYHGTPCTGVQNYGEIIVSELTVKGTAGMNMGLLPTAFLNIRQIALVQ